MRTELKILLVAIAVSGFAMQTANASNSGPGGSAASSAGSSGSSAGGAGSGASAPHSNSGIADPGNNNLNPSNTMNTPAPPNAPAYQQAQMSEPEGRGPHKVAITDEYGFKYDSRGNRLDARGYVISSHTR
jgi:hypothetical protein